MRIVNGKEATPVDFEDLDEGETFTNVGGDQIQIKTDGNSGCCLEDGQLLDYTDDEKVVRVACEVRVS